jgi:nicotinamidase-related amidase
MTSSTRQFVNPAILFEREDPFATVLLVIDMQVDFLNHMGRLQVERKRVDGLISNVNSAIARCQERGIPVVHIGNEFPRFSIANPFRFFAAIKGTPGAKLDPRVRAEGTCYLPKHHGDALTNPDLPVLLTRLKVRKVLLAGVFANGCVRATARGAIRRGYQTVILADCVGSGSERSTRRALVSMRGLGASIVQAGSTEVPRGTSG